MSHGLPDTETVLEIALACAIALLAGSLLALAAGSAAGRRRTRERTRRHAPAAGSVPDERHQNIVSVSAR
ncbi:MAG: hypothetical protein ACREOJ_15235 [Gemmatimonadaceae bacterium]